VPIKLSDETFYRTSEACELAGISRATLFRWLAIGIIEDVRQRDRRGWRLFNDDDINRIKTEVDKVSN
jgi:DNA-binding transcriptional MerR regulator